MSERSRGRKMEKHINSVYEILRVFQNLMWQCYGFRVDVNASHKHNNLDLLVVSVCWACEGTAATLTFSSILETKRQLIHKCAQVLLKWNCPGKEDIDYLTFRLLPSAAKCSLVAHSHSRSLFIVQLIWVRCEALKHFEHMENGWSNRKGKLQYKLNLID